MDQSTLDDLTINTIRTLAMDAVQQAHSGHPGTPMALAPVVYTLWQRFLRFDPNDPIWPNRDRFALSVGHASMLLYAMLYLTGVKAVDADYERLGEPSVTLEDIKRFRQLGSKCPGHPEYHLTSGDETTTGPLGQGVANSVGMAIAERWAERSSGCSAASCRRAGMPIFPSSRRRQGLGESRSLGHNAQCDCTPLSLAHRRRRGSRPLDPDPARIRRRWRF